MLDHGTTAVAVAVGVFPNGVPFLSQVLLITNDQANLRLATSEGLEAVTMRQFVRSVEKQFPSLVDLLAASAEALPGAEEGAGGAGAGAGSDAAGQANSASVAALGATMWVPVESTVKCQPWFMPEGRSGV
jgi:hypothetical protein